MADIESAIVDAILAGRVRPGARLGESDLAALYGVSRTRVREAMMRLQARGVVVVEARKGWFVAEPSPKEAAQVFQTRRILESGMAGALAPLSQAQRHRLHRHLEQERAALDGGDQRQATYLMGDFHIRLAEFLGNPVLERILRDLTARTILISMLSQTPAELEASHRGHRAIAEALAAGDTAAASRLMVEHIDEVEEGLALQRPPPDRLEALRRQLLAPELPQSPNPIEGVSS